jgi:SAM-dependent methyltransferase
MSQAQAFETELRDLILRGLGQQYTSIATTTGEAIQAGNHYQSVALGEVRTRGFRNDRTEFLDQIDFSGKTVLDLGSNLGELSREARKRGASLVDGFEYDPYFIEIGELVNAFNGTTRVSFYQRDIGDPEVYTDRYDMVLAFAVMGQGAAKTMWRIAEITDVLILETHRLQGNFEEHYMRPITSYFPYHRMLGESDWGISFDQQEVRATMVFAKTQEALDDALLDAVPVLEEPGEPTEAAHTASDGQQRHVDVTRTVLQKKFFDTFEFDTTDQLLAAVEGMNVDVRALARSRDARVDGYDGWVLWFLFLRGYLEYARTRKVGPGNAYFDYLSAHHDHALDPIVAQKVGLGSTSDYIMRQFEGMDRLRDAAGSPEVSEEIPPIQVFTSDLAGQRSLVYEPDAPDPISATRVDGWHRLFSARLFEVPQLRMDVIEEAESKPIFGEIKTFEFDGARLHVSGWCIHAHERLDLIEARIGQAAIVGSTTTTFRQDIADRFSHMPVHVTPRTGFELDKEVGPEALEQMTSEELVQFRLAVLQDWMPIGELSAFYLPGMFEVSWPDAKLAQRLMGTIDPRRLSTDSLRRLHAMLEPVKRYRALESFATVLDWGCRAGYLEAFLSHFMPDAEVTGIDTDEEAIEWTRQSGRPGKFSVVDPAPPTNLPADSFDLVLGHSMLGRLTAEEQSTWLEELRRLMKSGGYALLTVNGELLRPFIRDRDAHDEVEARGISSVMLSRYAEGSDEAVPRRATFQTKDYSIREYSRTFDVLRYATGALNDEDLIILRKP